MKFVLFFKLTHKITVNMSQNNAFMGCLKGSQVHKLGIQSAYGSV